jgi:hypothetical protein
VYVSVSQTCVDVGRFIERCNVSEDREAVKEAQEIGSHWN